MDGLRTVFMLKEKLRNKFLTELESISCFKVLIVDEESLFILDATVKMHEILQRNITSVEGLFKPRRSQPETAACYMISNSLKSVQQIITDFQRGIVYKEIHIVCVGNLSDSLFTKIKQSTIKQQIKTCKELGVDFVADFNMFSIEMPCLSNVYNSEMDSLLNYELKSMARKLASVLYNLEENPFIRYASKAVSFQSAQPKTLCSELAMYLTQDLKEEKRPRNGTLLILDRKMDMISPLIHDLHYQSLVADLLGLHRNKVKDSKFKEHKLDETDEIWKEFRAAHISTALQGITEGFNRFMNENKAALFHKNGGNPGDIEQLKNVLTSVDSFGKAKEVYSRHVGLCEDITKLYAERQLEAVVDLEQRLVLMEATAKHFPKLIKEVQSICNNPDVDHLDKVRLIFLLVITKEGITDSERRLFLDCAQFQRDEVKALTNLSFFEVSLGNTNRERDRPYSTANVKVRLEGLPYDSDNARHVPTLSFVIKDFLDGTLDEVWFPYLGAKPTGDEMSGGPKVPTANWSRKKPNWATRRERQDSVEKAPKKPRVVVFVIGGVSHNELVVAQKIQDEYNVEIVVGSTMLLTPDSFIEALKLMGNRGDESYYGFKRPPRTRRQLQEARDRNSSRSNNPEPEEEKGFFKRQFFSRGDGSAPTSSSSDDRLNDKSRRHGPTSENRFRERESSRDQVGSRADRVQRELTPTSKEKKNWFKFSK